MENYYYGKKYRWVIKDKYGWDINTKDIRKIKLNTINNNNINLDGQILFISLEKINKFDCDLATFDFKKMSLSIKDINFKCNNLEFAENIINSICKTKEYKVFDKYNIKQKI